MSNRPPPSIAGFSASDLDSIQCDRPVAVQIHDPDCPRLLGESCTCEPQLLIVPARERLQ